LTKWREAASTAARTCGSIRLPPCIVRTLQQLMNGRTPSARYGLVGLRAGMSPPGLTGPDYSSAGTGLLIAAPRAVATWRTVRLTSEARIPRFRTGCTGDSHAHMAGAGGAAAVSTALRRCCRQRAATGLATGKADHCGPVGGGMEASFGRGSLIRRSARVMSYHP